MQDKRGPSSSTGVVHRAFSLLQAVVSCEEPVGVRELGRRTGLPKSSVARLLATLDELGMVERTPDGRTVPGSALATLRPSSGAPSATLRDTLRPLLVDLVARYQESAGIGVDAGPEFVYLETRNGPSAIQVPDIGSKTYPFHLIAPGLAAMATWSPGRLDRYLSTPLERATAFSITDPDEIRSRLQRAIATGYVWTDQELDLEVNGLAVPIRSSDGLVGFASLYGPAYRFSEALLPKLGTELAKFVQAKTAALL